MDLHALIMDLPEVQTAIQRRAEAITQDSLTARVACLRKIEQVETAMQQAMSNRKPLQEKHDAAVLTLTAARNALAHADADIGAISGQYNHLHRQLRKDFGESHVIDALNHVDGMLAAMRSEQTRVSGLINQLTEIMPGYRTKKPRPELDAQLFELNQKLAMAVEAKNALQQLAMSELPPGEIQTQATAILAKLQ